MENTAVVRKRTAEGETRKAEAEMGVQGRGKRLWGNEWSGGVREGGVGAGGGGRLDKEGFGSPT